MVPLLTLRSANIKQHMEISMTRTHITLDTAWLRWLDIKSLSALYIEYPYLNEMIPLFLVFFVFHSRSFSHSQSNSFFTSLSGQQRQSRGRNKRQLSCLLHTLLMCYGSLPGTTYQCWGTLIMRCQVAEVNKTAAFYQSVFVKQDKDLFF